MSTASLFAAHRGYSHTGAYLLQESFDSPIDRRSDYYRQRVREGSGREGSGPLAQQAPAKPQPLLTPPNVLTLFRIGLVPVFTIVWFLPYQLSPLACAVTFNLAALTDWADGYLARKVILGPASDLPAGLHASVAEMNFASCAASGAWCPTAAVDTTGLPYHCRSWTLKALRCCHQPSTRVGPCAAQTGNCFWCIPGPCRRQDHGGHGPHTAGH